MLVSLSGLMLDFSQLGQTRFYLQLSHILHSSAAIVLMVGALGHIYIGSIGTEGALEGMITGRVDIIWTRQHHELWYQKLRDNADKLETDGE